MTVGNWELGKERPGIRHTAAIIALLGYDPEPAGDNLPARLRAIRRRLGLTQAELAARLGQDEHQICRWEGGRQKPHPWIASRIDLGLRTLEGQPANAAQGPLNFFDATRWRRRRTLGLAEVKPVTVGDQIRDARLRLGSSQKATGRILGVSRKVLYDWERNVTPIPSSRMARVRRLLRKASHLRRTD
jgi:DNA-binding transcriptional regulator YiaG